jgi:hypothetical protein
MKDVLAWTEQEARTWMARQSEDRISDVKTYEQAALSVRPGVFNKRAWTEAAQRYTRIALLDTTARADHAADVLVEAAREDKVKGDAVRRMLHERGPEFLGAAVVGLFEQITNQFASRDWTGTGVSSNEQTSRLLQVTERLEKFVETYLEDRDGSLDDDLIPLLGEYQKRLLEQAFNGPPGVPLGPLRSGT